MTLMTNDFNDHHDRMVVVEVFVYDKKAKPDALSSARLFLTILTLATILSRVSRVCINLNHTFPMKERSTNNCLNLLKILHIPSHSTRTEYGSRTTIKGRNKEFSLTLEGAEHVLIISLLDRFHDEVASLGQTTEEDESLW